MNPADVVETKTSKKPLEETAKEVMQEMNNQNLATAYSGAILDRKKESFQIYHNLETERRNTMEAHRVIISNLLANIDEKIALVETGIDRIVKFLKDRANQEEEYVKIMSSGLPKLGASFKNPTDASQFMNFARAMQECDDFHVRQSVNCNSLVIFIRKNVINDIIVPSEKEFKKQLHELQAPIEEIKKKLQAAATERVKKSKGYVVAYNEAQRGSKITKARDMFKNEMENVSLGYEEVRLMKSLAAKALILWNEVAKLLIKRFMDIQKAFNLYFQKYTDLYGTKAGNPEPVIQLMARLNAQDEVQQALRVRNMIKAEDLNYIRHKTGKTEVTFQEVFDVLADIPSPPDLAQSPLALKEWKAIKEGGLLRSNKQCSVIVSVDGNILVVERTPDGELVETDAMLSLQNLKIVPRADKKESCSVEVLETTPGVLMDSKKKVTFKFLSIDSADEFTHYVNNYTHIRGLQQKK